MGERHGVDDLSPPVRRQALHNTPASEWLAGAGRRGARPSFVGARGAFRQALLRHLRSQARRLASKESKESKEISKSATDSNCHRNAPVRDTPFPSPLSMLLLTAFSKFNRWAGPTLVRQALKVRTLLGVWGESPWLDALLLHPPARILSIEVHHQYREQQNQQPAGNDDDTDDDPAPQHRLTILESHWRTAGLTNPRLWLAWSLHGPFKKLLRAEILWAKHGTHVQQSLLLAGLSKSPQLRPHRHSIFPYLGDGNAAESASWSHLPTSRQLIRALDLADWTTNKDTRATTRAMRRLSRRVGGTFHTLRDGALCLSELPKTTTEQKTEATATAADAVVPLSSLSFEELVELAGGHVHYCGPLNALCERLDVYQVWTREYVQLLGAYLEDRMSSLLAGTSATLAMAHAVDGNAVERPKAVVLDVGAGDGLLVQLLDDYFARRSMPPTTLSPPAVSTGSARRNFRPRIRRRSRSPLESSSSGATVSPQTFPPPLPPPSLPKADGFRIEVVATDDGSWNVSPKAPVERLSFEQALDKYAPQVLLPSSSSDAAEVGDCTSAHNNIVIVVCSWMPQGVDWTEQFRRHNVDEYVLIGECDDGQCGDNWSTWGNPHFCDDDRAEDRDAKDHPETEGAADGSDPEPPSMDHPPFVMDGYERVNLDELAPHQFSRFDCRVSRSGRTVSFRRHRRRSALR